MPRMIVGLVLVLAAAAHALAADVSTAPASNLPVATRYGTLPETTSSFGAVVNDGWLYVYGGHITPTHVYSTQAVSGRFHRLNLSDGKTWEELPGGPGLQGMNLAAYNGKIYRVGGMEPRNAPKEKPDNFSRADCVRYDPATRKWDTLAPMPEARSSHDVAVVDGKLFAVGGWTMNGHAGNQWLDTMAMLDLTSDKPSWQSIKQPFHRRAMTAAAYEGKLYVIGGFTDDDEASLAVQIYDPASKQWSRGLDLPHPTDNGFAPAACTLAGRLYVSVADGTLYRLSGEEKQWVKAGTSTPRIVHRLAPFDSKVLILGGAAKGDTLNLIEALPAHVKEPDVEVQTNVMVPMRDGVKLATDIYLPPDRNGRLPVILTRLPYNKNGTKAIGKFYARHGYVFVAQDTRGRYASEGVWHMMTDDGRDGVDCAAWIAQQPWSDGKIGMFGTSYVGGTQHAMAMEKTPQLVTVIPVDAMSNLGHQSMRNAGAFEMRFWNWVMQNSGRGSQESHDPATAGMLNEMSDHRIDYLMNLPLRRGTTPLKFAPEYEDWLVSAMGHGANDGFWDQNAIIDHPERYKDIPVYLVGGWYDSWAGNTTANFMTLTRSLHSDVYLIMGPWIHGQQAKSSHGQADFGDSAAIANELAWKLEWYDHWLKGTDNSVGKAVPFASKVRIFVMGSGDGHKTDKGLLYHGGSWRDEHEWPLARTHYTDYYFAAAGQLSPTAPPDTDSSTSFTYDPKHPVPTIGGNISSGDGLLLQGAWDQRGGPHVWNYTLPLPLSARNDIVVFQSAALAGNVEVTGEIEVKLWASSNAPDTDFTAKLIDVYPPSADWPGGFDLNIGDGIVRARFREGLKEEKLMKPGELYPFTIHLYPSSNVFKKGHRIRVDISSSNFPRFDLNPNTGEPLNDNRRVQSAVNTIVHDKAHPSHIVLPVIGQ